MDTFGSGDSSPLFALQMMTGMLVPLLLVLLVVPVVLYVMARWRANREPTPDPQLGLKFALSFFKWQGYQLTLLAGAMLVYSIVTSGSAAPRSEIYRPAFGFLVPGLLVFGSAAAALTRTNQAERPGVGRLFAGFHFMLTGAVAFTVLVMAFQTLFEKHGGGESARLIWSLTLVYVSAWVVQGLAYMKGLGLGLGLGGPAPAEPPSGPGTPPIEG